jgi:Uma2 family endonuclease
MAQAAPHPATYADLEAVPPHLVAEILSPSTRRLDLGPKRRIYGGADVPFLWFLDLDARSLEAFALTGGHWLLLGTAVSGEAVSLAPFDAVSFPLDDLFPFADPAASAPPET